MGRQRLLHDLPPKADLILPFFKNIAYPMGVLGFIVLSYFVIVGTSNAVNLTDGLDGLAIMPAVMVAGALGIFAYVAGNAVYSQIPAAAVYPGRGRTDGVLRRARRGRPRLSLVQRLSGQVFMGDVGALAIGAALGTVAVIVRQEIVLLHHGRRVRGRDAVGDAAGAVLQVERRQAHFPHGAAAPPLRTVGLEGVPGRRALLDHHA